MMPEELNKAKYADEYKDWVHHTNDKEQKDITLVNPWGSNGWETVAMRAIVICHIGIK